MVPPINTGAGAGHTYPAGQAYNPNAPPVYPSQGGYGYSGGAAPQGVQMYGRQPTDDGNQRNKAQLIVGIDFV